MTALAEYYESGNAPHEALGRAARRLAGGGALYLGGGVGIEKQRGKDSAEKFVITKADGGSGASFDGPLSAVMRAFSMAGSSTAPDTPGGTAQVSDPAAAARLRELADEEAEAKSDIRRYELRLQRKASNPRPLYSPAIVSDDDWEARRIEELKGNLKSIAQERAKLIATGKVEEVEQARPGTNFTKIPPKNVKKLSGLVKHYKEMAHGFTACVRDQVKHGLSDDHAKRRCAVVTDLGAGTTKWRKGGKKSSVAEAHDEHVLGEAVEQALGRLLVIEETMGAGETVELAAGAGGYGDVRDALGEGAFHDLTLLALAEHPFGTLWESFMAAGGGGSGPASPTARARQQLRGRGKSPAGARLPAANMRGKAREKGAKDSEFEKKHPRGRAGTSEGGKFVRSGSSGAETRAVQQRVGSKVDGQFGAKTAADVKAFQRRHRLVVDGVVGHQTALALAGKFARARAAKTGALHDADRKRLSESAPKRRRART